MNEDMEKDRDAIAKILEKRGYDESQSFAIATDLVMKEEKRHA